MQKLILIGGGGHCKACINVIEQTNQYEIIGILDQAKLRGTSVLGYKIVGTDADIAYYKTLGFHFLITVGQIKTADLRKKLFGSLIDNDTLIATIISPQANVSKYAQIKKGTIIMHGVTVNASVVIGENCILNTGCNVEHDVVIGHHTHVSTHAVINGNCNIGNQVFIGSNATISSQISLTNSVIIGAGAVVVKNIIEKGTYVGNPLRQIKP